MACFTRFRSHLTWCALVLCTFPHWLAAQSEYPLRVEILEQPPAPAYNHADSPVPSLRKTSGTEVFILDSATVRDCEVLAGEFLQDFVPSSLNLYVGPLGGNTLPFSFGPYDDAYYHGFGNLYTVKNVSPHAELPADEVTLHSIVWPHAGGTALYTNLIVGEPDSFEVIIYAHITNNWGPSNLAPCLPLSPNAIASTEIYRQSFTIEDLRQPMHPHELILDAPLVMPTDSFWIYIRTNSYGVDDTLAPALVDASRYSVVGPSLICGTKAHSYLGLFRKEAQDGYFATQRLSTISYRGVGACPSDFVHSEFLLFPKLDVQHVPEPIVFPSIGVDTDTVMCGVGNVTFAADDPGVAYVVEWSLDNLDYSHIGLQSPPIWVGIGDTAVVWARVKLAAEGPKRSASVRFRAISDSTLCAPYAPDSVSPPLAPAHVEIFLDANRDSLQDILVIDSLNQTTRFYLHSGNWDANGLPIYELTTADLPYVAGSTWKVVDVDGNGYLDLVMHYADSVRVFLNDALIGKTSSGPGFFAEGTTALCIQNPLLNATATAKQVVITDITADGRPDLGYVAPGSTAALKKVARLSNTGSGACALAVGFCGTAVTLFEVNAQYTPLLRPFDYDNDGDADLLVLLYDPAQPQLSEHALQLYRNDAGSYTLLPNPGFSAVSHLGFASIFDFDGDGLLDVLTGSTGTLPNRLHRNQGNGTFADVSAQWSTKTAVGNYALAQIVDVDNDGRPDVYWHGTAATDTARLLRNTPQGFLEVTNTAFSQTAPLGTTATWGDIDNNGYQDAYVYRKGAAQPALALLNNMQASNRRHLRIQLQSCAPNTDAAGARVVVTAPNLPMQTQIYGQSPGNSPQAPHTLHFGMGSATTAQVNVYWPGMATPVQYSLNTNQMVRIVQDPGCCTLLNTQVAQDGSPSARLFPNPSTGLLNVALSTPSHAVLTLFSANGQQVLQETVKGSVHRVITTGLVPGIYLATLQGPQLPLQTFKIVLE